MYTDVNMYMYACTCTCTCTVYLQCTWTLSFIASSHVHIHVDRQAYIPRLLNQALLTGTFMCTCTCTLHAQNQLFTDLLYIYMYCIHTVHVIS